MRSRGNTFRKHAPPSTDGRGPSYGKGKCHNGGKVIFKTKKKAVRQMDATNASSLKTYGEKQIEAVYECRYCGYWHFTSQVQRG
jgi:DNA-directed RNA polymerase subunit RPC12/RpoP